MTPPADLGQVEELREETLQTLSDIREHIDRFEQLLDEFEEGILERLDRLEGWTEEGR